MTIDDDNYGLSTKTKVVLNKCYLKEKEGCTMLVHTSLPEETLESIDNEDDLIEDAQYCNITKGSFILLPKWTIQSWQITIQDSMENCGAKVEKCRIIKEIRCTSRSMWKVAQALREAQ